MTFCCSHIPNKSVLMTCFLAQLKEDEFNGSLPLANSKEGERNCFLLFAGLHASKGSHCPAHRTSKEQSASSLVNSRRAVNATESDRILFDASNLFYLTSVTLLASLPNTIFDLSRRLSLVIRGQKVGMTWVHGW